MKNYLIAERYAKALCNTLADEELDDVGSMLAQAAEIYTQSEAFSNVLQSPAIRFDKRRDVLQQVLTTSEIDERVKRIAEILLTRGRITLLPDVAVVFDMLVNKRLNRVSASVTTAAETTPEQNDRLKQALKTWFGREVIMDREIDPGILGGVVARVGDTVIDGSVQTRIERLREHVLEYDIRVQGTS
ncbi:MAG: F0F1 ATP synthase subunit delta [Candidatus Hydrogenedentes bacterium]|nr:F0F1 ATP synthase subunit delta [Candidatus Hydrogenedentota bacterium]